MGLCQLQNSLFWRCECKHRKSLCIVYDTTTSFPSFPLLEAVGFCFDMPNFGRPDMAKCMKLEQEFVGKLEFGERF